jgi:hypothetical protein
MLQYREGQTLEVSSANSRYLDLCLDQVGVLRDLLIGGETLPNE